MGNLNRLLKTGLGLRHLFLRLQKLAFEPPKLGVVIPKSGVLEALKMQ